MKNILKEHVWMFFHFQTSVLKASLSCEVTPKEKYLACLNCLFLIIHISVVISVIILTEPSHMLIQRENEHAD